MKIKKNKFIIGLSTTVLGSAIAAGGQVAYADEPVDITKDSSTQPSTTEVIEKSADFSKVETGDAGVPDTSIKEEETVTPAGNQESEIKEDASADTKEEVGEGAKTNSDQEANTEETTKEDVIKNETTSEDTTKQETQENTEATESISAAENPDKNKTDETTEDLVDVNQTETTDENLAGEEAKSLEEKGGAHTSDLTDTEQTADSTKSETSPSETPEADTLLKKENNTDEPSLEEQVKELVKPAGEDAPVVNADGLTTQDNLQTGETNTVGGNGGTGGDGDGNTNPDKPESESRSQLSNISAFSTNLPMTEAGAESPDGDNLQKSTDFNYAKDEAKIKDYSGEGRYRSTQMEQGAGTAASYNPPDEMDKFIDGYRYHRSEPSKTSEDKTKWGIEIEFDKKKGQRTYTDFYFTNTGDMGGVLDTGKVSANEIGVRIAGGEKDPNYKATSEIKIDPSGRSTRNLNLNANEVDLKHINDKDNTNTTMAWQGKYKKDNPDGPKATEGSSSIFGFTVNPWPNENDSLALIKLNGSHEKIEFVQGQTITTGVKVQNLDENARERLVGQVYHPETGEVVEGAKAYINDSDMVVIEMPKGAVDESGKINEDSIFYNDVNYKGLQNLEVKFFARPRTADEFKAIVVRNGNGYYTDTGAGAETIKHKGESVVIDKQGIDRYDHYNLIGEFEIQLDDESNYDIITKDITADKNVTDKMLRLKAGVDKKIEQVDNPNSTAPHKYTTAKANNAVDSYLEEEYKDYLIPVKGEENIYRTEDNWLVEVDPDDPLNIKVSTPIGAKKGESLSLAVTHLFTNGSEKDFLIDYVVREESIEIPNYKSAVTEAGDKVTNTPTNNYTETKPKPVKYELESTSIVDDNGKTWTLSINENTGEITATAPGEIDDKVSTINVPVIATYIDQNLKDKDGNDLVYTEKSSATFTATAPQEGEVRYSQDNTIEYETIVRYNPAKDPTESGVVQEGKNGKYTVDYTVTYKNGDVVAGPTMVEGTERDRVEPRPQIFEIGTKGASVDVTAPNEQTIKIPHTTDVTYDDTKPLGYREETPGQDGEIKITYQIEQNDGQATVKATETTKEAKPGKLVIGTKPSETETDTYTNQITNDKVTINYVDDPDMNVGQTREGDITGGEVKTVIESKYNPETGEIDTVEKTEVTPIVKTIYRGTKNFTGTFTHIEEQIIPFETEVVVDPNKKTEEPEITQTGKTGTQKRTITQSYVNGTMSEKNIGKYELVEGPTKQIITVGSLTEGTHSKEEEIPFETKVEYDSSIEAGNYVIEKTGVVGKQKTTWTIKNSEIADTKVETITEKQDALIKVGDKHFEGPVTHTETIELPYNIEIIESNEVPVGTRFVRQEGQKGSVDVTYTQNFKEGKPDGELSRVESNRNNAQNMVVVVGTKAIESTVKPEIKVIEDDTLPAGTVEEGPITEGKVVTTVEKSTDPLTGKEVTREKTEVTAPTQTIKVGTKAYDGQVIYKEQRVTPFETEIVFDETLAHGETQTTQAGKNKVEERTITQNLSNGTETTKEEGDFKVVEEGQKQIIRVGTKQDGTYTHTQELPFEYKIVEDSSIQKGKYEIDDSEATQGTVTTRFTIENSVVNEEKTTSETVKGNPVVIKVGTADFTGSVSHDVVEAIPYDVKVEYDSTMKAGEYEVETKGVAGSKTTRYSFDIKNGDVVNQNPETTVIEEKTVDPTTQVIKVGTKVLDDNTQKESNVPVNVKFTPTDTIAQGTAIRGEFTPGKVVDKVVSKYNPETGKIESTITPEVTPAELEILVGTQAYTGTFEYVERRNIPYETTIKFDDTLAAGQTRVDQEGKNGVEERKITQSFTNGTLSTQNVPETFTNISDPTNKVVRVGTMTNGKVVHKEAIPFEVEVKYDPSLKAGEYKYETDADGKEKKGVAGEQSITYTIVNSEVTETSEANITKQPEKAVILVGNKDFEGTVSHEVTREVPFEVEIQYDDTLKAGEYKVTQQGELGSETTKYEFNIKNGEAVDEKPTTSVVESKSKAPVKQIVKVGRKPAENTNDFSSEIGIDVKFVPDENKEQGSQPETTYTPGTVVNKVVNKYNPETGEIETTTEPQVTKGVIEIKYGTKDYTGEVKYIEKEYIDYNTKVTVDYSLKPNEVKVDTKGQVGIRERNVTQKVVNGKLTDTTRDEYKTTSQPVEQVIRIGASVTAEKPADKTIEIPFATTINEDPTKPIGYKNIDTEGENGSVTITFSEEIKDGKVTVTANEDRKEPTTQVVTIGTKAIQNVNGEKEEAIKPVVNVVYDPELEQGKIETEVEDGKAKASSDGSYNGETGEIDNNTDVEVTQPTITVTVGTKPINKTKTEEIPFETEYVFDPTLDVGQQETQTEGQNGSRTITFERTSDGTTITEKEIEVNVTEPTKKVVKVGTKQTVTTEEIETPYETVIEYDNTKPVGEKEVTQKGTPGKKKVTVTTAIDKDGNTVSNTNTEVVKEPKKEIITVGTKVTDDTIESTVTEIEVPFETTVIADDTLENGKIITDKEGKKGLRTITVTTEVKNGVAGEPQISDVITEKPQDAIIRVGTMCEAPELPKEPVVEESDLIEIPFETKYIYDDNLAYGEVEIDSEGENGSYREVTTTKIVDGNEVTKTTRKIETLPTTRVVRVGTKNAKVVNGESKEEIPFETETIEDPTLDAGQEIIDQRGEKGIKYTQIYKIDVESGAILPDPDDDELVIKEPVKEIKRVGTKKPTNSDNNIKPSKPTTPVSPTTQTITREIPYDTVFIYDNTIDAGKKVVTSPGQKGEKIVTVTSRVVNGKIVTETTEEITKQPKTEYVRVGTKAPKYSGDDVVTNESKVLIPFETEIIYDDTLPLGQTEVVSEGRDGIQVVTITTRYQNGLVVDTTTDGYIEREAINKVVRVGTKTDGQAPTIDENTGIIDLPTTTEDNDHIIVIPEGAIDDDNHVVVIPEEAESDEDDASKKNRPVNEEAADDQVGKASKNGDQAELVTKGTKIVKSSEDDANAVNIKRSAVGSTNPKTGITGTAGIISTLGISLAGITASRKKKENDEE